MYLEKDDKKPYFYFKDCYFNEIYGSNYITIRIIYYLKNFINWKLNY